MPTREVYHDQMGDRRRNRAGVGRGACSAVPQEPEGETEDVLAQIALLARQAERIDGRSVAVVDLDPQASATNWSERREAETPVVASSTPVRLEAVLSAAEQQGADLVLIDTPPRADQTAISAAKVADLVIIPCRPAILDLETVATTIELVRSAGNQQIVVVLNGVPPRGTRGDQAAEILQSMGIEFVLLVSAIVPTTITPALSDSPPRNTTEGKSGRRDLTRIRVYQ